jgi:hypothetical protein
MTAKSLRERLGKSINEYVDGTQHVSHLEEGADADVMIRNLRWMAVHNGAGIALDLLIEEIDRRLDHYQPPHLEISRNDLRQIVREMKGEA